jgi:hypothetical protein
MTAVFSQVERLNNMLMEKEREVGELRAGRVARRRSQEGNRQDGNGGRQDSRQEGSRTQQERPMTAVYVPSNVSSGMKTVKFEAPTKERNVEWADTRTTKQ